MQYKGMIQGRFLRRLNRFTAEVEIEQKIEKVHVKNTGRLRELLIEDAVVLLQPAANPDRKTKFSLICVQKNGQWVNIDSMAPNQIVEEMVQMGRLFSDVTYVKREKTFGNSRFDLYLEHHGQGHYVEVKGVTLEDNGVARFPDAPTERGVKHVRELIEAKRQGYLASIVFVIQMKGVTRFEPYWIRQPEFALALQEAQKAGVDIMAVDCIVTEDTLMGDQFVPVNLDVQNM